tara:strand:+ start:1244 stop:5260 length:4017 start_codon:yes stop_codon:yes gene_type:complete
MAEFRLGRLKFNWRSDWLVNTAYVIDDIVKYGANTYVCKTNHTSSGNENQFYSADLTSNWTLHTEGISNKGDWQASTWYKVNDIYKYGNTQYRVVTGHTSAATFEEGDTTLYVVEYLQSFNYEDTWDSATQYQDGDVVTYGGYTYVAKSVHVNKPPSYNLTNDWDIITTGFNVVGEWSSSTDYKQGDVVLHGGYSYVAITTSTNTVPTTEANWSLVTKGVAWKGNWDSTVNYQLGDAVKRLSNSYIGVATAGSLNQDPSTDSNSTYWSMLAEGAANNVMTTQGDMVYYTTGAARLPVGDNGQVLAVSPNGIPQWELNSVTHPVYYVTEEGKDTNDGSNISRSFHSVNYACGIATGPATIYVKAGSYAETLPIIVPPNVSIVGDNLRTSRIVPAEHYDHTFVSADADSITVTGGGTKTPVAGTTYNSATGDLVLEIGSHTLTTSNTIQIGNDTIRFTCSLDNHNKVKSYPRAHKDPVSGNFISITATTGTTITVNVGKANLSTHQDLTLANAPATVSYGSSIFNGNSTKCAVILDSSYDDKTIQIRTLSGGAWTTSDTWENGGSDISITSATVRENKHSTMFQLSNSTMLKDILMENMTGFTPAGTVTTRAGNISGSILTGSNLFPDLVGTTVTGSGVQTGTKVIGFISGTQIEVDIQQTVSTTFTFTAQQYDPNNAHIKGVFVALNPESRIIKSPYVSNCSAKSVKGIGAIVDGGIHRQFVDGTATPSNKSIVFDSFTNIHDEGMAFWVTDGGTAEMVSCFTYYNHISYAATRGGRIRSLAGNSSWGKYGIVSSGFSPLEQTRDGQMEGLILQFDPDSMSGTGFQVGERIRGNTSTAWGTVNSVQGTTQNLIYYSVITEGDTVGVGTGFVPGETITAQTSGTTAPLINNPDANRGQAGRVLVLSGLGTSPTLEENGSIEFITGSGNGGYNSDDITGADPFTFVINGVSQTGPVGKGNVYIDRGQWTTSGAGHTGGTTTFTQYPVQGGSFTLLTPAQSSDTTFSTSTISGFNPGEYCLSPTNELCKIVSFPTANSMNIQRAQDGAGSASSYNIGDTFTSIGQTNQIASAEINKDFTGVSTSFRATIANRFDGAIGDYVKIDNEFVKITGTDEDTYGTTTVTLVEEKANKTFDEQEMKIRYIFSQARLTGHDFLQVGTGGTVTTNWPAAPVQDPVQSQEITEDFPGRVFYVSTDQQGNFRVGKYFRVNQATGAATLNANSFDLSGLTSIRLGSIGAQLGASINEFSTDGTMAQNSNEKVPTQAAVRTYVATRDAEHLLMAQNHATLGLSSERSQTQTDNSNTLSSAQSYTNTQISNLRNDVETEFRKEVQVSEFFVGQLG